MSRVAVLCPSRDRWHELKAAAESVRATSKADFLVYLDEGTENPPIGPVYRFIPNREAIPAKYTIGPRLGCAQALNALVAADNEHDTFLMMTDDSVITAPGWDEYVVSVFDAMPGRIGAISAHLGGGTDEGYTQPMDMPCVSREWIEAVGYFAHPRMKHYGWPSVIESLSEGLCLVNSPADKLAMKHTQVSSNIDPNGVYARYYASDSAEFCDWYAHYRNRERMMLQAKIEAVSVG